MFWDRRRFLEREREQGESAPNEQTETLSAHAHLNAIRINTQLSTQARQRKVTQAQVRALTLHVKHYIIYIIWNLHINHYMIRNLHIKQYIIRNVCSALYAKCAYYLVLYMQSVPHSHAQSNRGKSQSPN